MTYIDNFLKEYKKQVEERDSQMSELIVYWQNEGRKILKTDKWKLWDSIVPVRLGDVYMGKELRDCLDIIKILENGTFKEVERLINHQNHSGSSYNLVCSMVIEFSTDSDKFIEYMDLFNK